ncbi:MAG: hypothetical protein HQK66_01450 [Desulfamplus sp.]|nr:hypothetical protein [Desulfamplus sp.]
MARENDIVLVYLEDNPVFFARVESIWPDVKRDWFNIELLVLQIPLKVIVWTLKDLYIEGEEFFMGGKKMRMEVVEPPQSLYTVDDDDEIDRDDHEGHTHNASVDSPARGNSKTAYKEKRDARVISIADFQKRKK